MCRWIGLPAGSPFTRTRLRSSQAGFTLLEVLVAFAVLAVMIVPILQVFGGGLGAVESARARSTAALLARSKLAEVGAGEILTEGETSGTSNVPGFRWRRTIVRDTSELMLPEQDGGLGRRQAGFGDRRGGTGRGRGGGSLGRSSGRQRNLGGLQSDDLIRYEVTVTVEWDGLRGAGALTLWTLRLGSQPNNPGAGRQ
jgi:type II secretion system protein I